MRFRSLRFRLRTLMALVALLALPLALIAPAMRPRPKPRLWLFLDQDGKEITDDQDVSPLKAQFFAAYIAEKYRRDAPQFDRRLIDPDPPPP
jgi:hypothetical protein